MKSEAAPEITNAGRRAKGSNPGSGPAVTGAAHLPASRARLRSKRQPKKGAEGSAGSSAPHVPLDLRRLVLRYFEVTGGKLAAAALLAVAAIYAAVGRIISDSAQLDRLANAMNSITKPAAGTFASPSLPEETAYAGQGDQGDGGLLIPPEMMLGFLEALQRGPAEASAAPWQSLRTAGLWWFRIFGFGLWAASYRLHPAPFSERFSGRRRVLPLWRWRVKILWPGDLD